MNVQDVSMNSESKHDDQETDEDVRSMKMEFSTPRRRQRKKSSNRFEFSVTPEPSRRSFSTSRGRSAGAELEESPARYSPSKVKAAVRSFADFLHFLEQQEHPQDSTLMPMIIERFAELGAVIESQKRHIDRWKGKELDLAIEEAQQNLELTKELGETIQKQEQQIAENLVEKQKWEEKYHLAAHEVETLKIQATYQIQQLQSEVSRLRQAGLDMESNLKEQESSYETLKQHNDTLRSDVKQLECNISEHLQENRKLEQQNADQSDMMQSLHQEVNDLHEHHESVLIKVKELKQDITAWQEKYKEKEKQIHEMENALMHGRQQVEKQDENLVLVKAENRKLQEHMDMMAQEHEKHLADYYKSQREAEQRLRQALEQESTRFQTLKEEAEEMRGQIESQAMSAMNQREQQLLDEKARLEDELQHQISKLDEENAELRAKVEGLKDINRRKSIEIGRLMVVSHETERQKEIHSADTQRMQQLQEEVDRVKNQNKKLLQDMATKDATYEETIKSQSGQFETQYNELVSQVTNQINDLTRENEQLRAELDDAAKKVEMYEGKLSLQSVEHDEWRIECEKLQRQMHDITRGNEALKIEFNRRAHDLELKNKENAELHAQIERLKSPDHERMKDVERIQHERIELEEQNLELQRQLELIRVEADLRLNEAHQVHNHALEQESAHENTIRLLCEDKEGLKRDMIALASERSALEFQVSTAHNEVERLKASVQKLETDNMGLEFQLKEVMRQATEQIDTQKQLAAMARDESRIEMQKMSAQLAHRDTQMNEKHEQLHKLQQTITLQEERLRNEQYRYKRLQTKHEELRMALESLYSERHGLDDMMSNLLRERQPGMEEEDLIQKLEWLICEMDRLAEEQCDKVMALQVDSDTKLAMEQQYSSDVQARLEEENAKIQQQVVSDSLEKQQSQIVHLQRERDEQNRVVKGMEETIAALEVERLTQSSASDELQKLQAAKNELQTMYDRLKAEMMTQLTEKESEVTELQDNLTEMQAKLDQEKEMSRHLMDRSSYDKQEQLKKSQVEKELQARVKELEAIVSDYQFKLQVSESGADTEDEAQVKELEALVKQLQDRLQVSENTAVRMKKDHARVEELEEQVKLLERKLSAKSREQQQQIKELEASVEQFRHELQISEQSIAAKEQSAMHEKLHQERKYRSLLKQYDALVAENTASVTKLSAKEAETVHLRQEVYQLQEEIERLQREIRDNTAAMDTARNHLNVSEQLTLKLESMQDELEARANDVRKHESDLAVKDNELLRAQEDADDVKRHLENQIQSKEGEVTLLKQENAILQEQLEREKLLSKQITEVETTAREKATMKEDEPMKREQLKSRIAYLEEAVSTMLNQFRREVRRLNIDLGIQGSTIDEKYVDDNDVQRGIMEISACLRRYQQLETRQNALLDRKERQLQKLKLQFEELEKYVEKKQRDPQMDIMSMDVSKLKLENNEQRENAKRDVRSDASAEYSVMVDKYEKLKHRVGELKEANSKLKESCISKRDVKAFMKKIDKLSKQVADKDLQIQALQNFKMARLKGIDINVSAGSRRFKDLPLALQEKEEKLMVLNDHLTGLMVDNMQLKHSMEQYAIRYGPLDTTLSNGVIDNSDVRFDDHTRQQQAIR